MIVRVARAEVARDLEPDAFAAFRSVILEPQGPEGMESMHLARRTGGPDVHLIAVSVWRDVDALAAAIGPTWHQPSFFPQIDKVLTDRTLEHSRPSRRCSTA